MINISLNVSETNEGYARFTLESSFDYVTYCKVIAYPYYGFNETQYEVGTYTLEPNQTIERSITLPKSVRKEWFADFLGGYVFFGVKAYDSEIYTDYHLVGSDSIRGLFWGHHASGKFGLALTDFSDIGSHTNLSGIVSFVRGNNNIRTVFAVTALDTTRTIENINVYTTYNLVELKSVPTSITDLGTGQYSVRVDLPNVFSPNVRFDISIVNTYESTTTQTVTTGLKVNCPINLQDYQEPIIYAEVTSPMTGSGDCTIGVSGRYQPTLKNQYNGDAANDVSVTYYLYSNGETITSNKSVSIVKSEDGLFTGTVSLSGLNYNEPYSIKFYAQDLIGSLGSTNIELANRPVFDWNHEDFNFNVPVYHQEDIMFQQDQGIAGIDAYGTPKTVFTPQTSTGDTVIGYDNYNQESGNTLIYGNSVDIMAHEGVTINGESITDIVKDTSTTIMTETINNEVPEIATNIANDVVTNALANKFGNVLWEGSNVMAGGTTITLSDSITNQVSGVVLVFCGYDADGVPVSWNSHFVSKDLIDGFDTSLPGQFGGGHTFLLANNAGLSVFGAKYLYFTPTTIRGQISNDVSDTAPSGITFNNNYFYLAYVIGV